ncbi:MAG: hypothetical protein N3E38_02960, partial [Candidatus Aenigmarchaeota archaeon]|nr:hypothetical protein [Candidatus Aenigmarchaeota archaeon]
MSKASVSEILLTIGVLICAAILLIQIQQIVKLKTKSAEAESIYMLGRDLEMLIDKTKIMDFAIYSYKPKIKHYTLEVEENKISVKDKISGHVYYFYVDEKVNPTVFEESEDICVVKQKIAKNTIKILPSNCNEVSFDFDEDIEEPTTPHNFFWPIESYIR